MNRSLDQISQIAKDWIDAWNGRDLDRIMNHYTSDVEFEANTVVSRWHKPDGVLHGQVELGEHFRRGLELAPSLHFTLEQVFFAPSGYAIVYTRDNGNRAIDVVELSEDGKARKVKAYYADFQQ